MIYTKKVFLAILPVFLFQSIKSFEDFTFLKKPDSDTAICLLGDMHSQDSENDIHHVNQLTKIFDFIKTQDCQPITIIFENDNEGLTIDQLIQKYKDSIPVSFQLLGRYAEKNKAECLEFMGVDPRTPQNKFLWSTQEFTSMFRTFIEQAPQLILKWQPLWDFHCSSQDTENIYPQISLDLFYKECATIIDRITSNYSTDSTEYKILESAIQDFNGKKEIIQNILQEDIRLALRDSLSNRLGKCANNSEKITINKHLYLELFNMISLITDIVYIDLIIIKNLSHRNVILACGSSHTSYIKTALTKFGYEIYDRDSIDTYKYAFEKGVGVDRKVKDLDAIPFELNAQASSSFYCMHNPKTDFLPKLFNGLKNAFGIDLPEELILNEETQKRFCGICYKGESPINALIKLEELDRYVCENLICYKEFKAAAAASTTSTSPICCANCDIIIINESKMRCSACANPKNTGIKPVSIYYCSQTCQKAHWPTHKKECLLKK